MNKKLELLFNQIKKECITMITNKKVDIDDLSFEMGMNKKVLYDLFENRNEDFSLYLKMYNILTNW